MVIVRCTNCAAVQLRGIRSSTTSAQPVGYPNPAVVCGTPGCNQPGLVWLQGADAVEYRNGGRATFPLTVRHPVKVRVDPAE